jgi:hypothetical protein
MTRAVLRRATPGTRRLAWLAAVAALPAVGGCLFGEVAGIRCDADTECPTAYFCDIPREVCRAESATFAAPVVALVGLRDGDNDVVTSPRVAARAPTVLAAVLQNTGGSVAQDIALSLTGPACLNLVLDERDQPGAAPGGGSLSVGQTVDVPFVLRPDGSCGPAVSISFGLVHSGRETSGSFSVALDDGTASAASAHGQDSNP